MSVDALLPLVQRKQEPSHASYMNPPRSKLVPYVMLTLFTNRICLVHRPSELCVSHPLATSCALGLLQPVAFAPHRSSIGSDPIIRNFLKTRFYRIVIHLLQQSGVRSTSSSWLWTSSTLKKPPRQRLLSLQTMAGILQQRAKM